MALPGEVSADSTPPTTSIGASPGQNANGWNNTSATVTLNATDNPGGSGVRQIQFVLAAAQNSGLQTVTGNVASITISAQGISVLSYFAKDNAGNLEQTQKLMVKIDEIAHLATKISPGATESRASAGKTFSLAVQAER